MARELSLARTLTRPDSAANDAPTITITANDFTEDSGNNAGDVVATYITDDQDGDTLTVTWTSRLVSQDSNNNDLYTLNTSSNNATLTAAGVAYLNEGNSLPAVALTVTDDGAGTLTGTDSDTPGFTAANDAPTISLSSSSEHIHRRQLQPRYRRLRLPR